MPPPERLPLSNLVIAGVGKAGTTSLFWYLGQHPDVCPSDLKELNHFAPHSSGRREVASLESYAASFNHWRGERYRLEASPRYWFRPEIVIPAILQTLDRPRVIIALRDPAARLWSAYTYLKSRGRIDRAMTCDQFITACELKEGGADAPTSGPVTPLMVGMYGDYLGQWLKAFEHNLRVVFADDLFSGPQAVVEDLCRWLEIPVEPARSISYEIRNQTVGARSHVAARTAWAAMPLAARLLRRQPAVRATLRRAYTAINGTKQSERFPAESRARLQQIYLESNHQAAKQLAAAGYGSLPNWLASARSLQGEPRR